VWRSNNHPYLARKITIVVNNCNLRSHDDVSIIIIVTSLVNGYKLSKYQDIFDP